MQRRRSCETHEEGGQGGRGGVIILPVMVYIQEQVTV